MQLAMRGGRVLGFSIGLDFTVSMLELCDNSNLLLVLYAEERRAFLKLL